MQTKRKNEFGSIMVEMIAVLALMGLMGTVLFRQVQRRNDDLSNINMASEIRVIKDATTAYIQANRGLLVDTFCEKEGYQGPSTLEDIESFMPEVWRSARDESGELDDENLGSLVYYKIYWRCDLMGNDDNSSRNVIQALVVPWEDYLPDRMDLRRASRIAGLIGADGGVCDGDQIYGTMGSWQIDNQNHDGKAICADNAYVASTSTDIYIPEVETSIVSTVPHSLAVEVLHGTDYFSVGSGDKNCVTNYAGDKFQHELTDVDDLNDQIARVGADACEPLFWVGTTGVTGDNSDSGHVYVKNNLYIGRDNAQSRQAVGIEAGASNDLRQINVYDTAGKGVITLNAAGQVIGHKMANGKGYKLDASNGEIVLFREKEVEISGNKGYVQIPVLRLKDGRLETSIEANYGSSGSDVYKVDPAGESLMNDIRLTSRGGAKLSEILPDYIAKEIRSIAQDAAYDDISDENKKIAMPFCPDGYRRAITVTPVKYSQYVESAELTLNFSAQTNEAGSGGVAHSHSVTIQETLNNMTQNASDSNDDKTLVVNGYDAPSGSSLRLVQKAPVFINIKEGTGGDENKWLITLKYGNSDPTTNDPIIALAQTYCVYDSETIAQTKDDDSKLNSDYSAYGLGKAAKATVSVIHTPRTCSDDSGCDESTERCVDGICQKRGSCSASDGTHLGGKVYCYDNQEIYIECLVSADCPKGLTCVSNVCEAAE